MDIERLLSSPVGIAIVVVAALVLLFVAWKIGKLGMKLLFLFILAAIVAAVFFFMKGGF
jgi:hypothetical protein